MTLCGLHSFYRMVWFFLDGETESGLWSYKAKLQNRKGEDLNFSVDVTAKRRDYG